MRNSSLLPVILSMDFVLGNQAKQPCTIKSEINYQLLPSCINQCLWDIGDDDTPPLGGNMGRYIGCVPPFLNGCYCNPDSASLAHSYITSCVDFLCQTSGPDEISKGTSLYASYCTKVLGAEYTPGIVATTNTEVSTTLHCKYFMESATITRLYVYVGRNFRPVSNSESVQQLRPQTPVPTSFQRQEPQRLLLQQIRL